MNWLDFGVPDYLVQAQQEWEQEQRRLRAWEAGMSRTKLGKMNGTSAANVAVELLEATRRRNKPIAYRYILSQGKLRTDPLPLLDGLKKLRIEST